MTTSPTIHQVATSSTSQPCFINHHSPSLVNSPFLRFMYLAACLEIFCFPSSLTAIITCFSPLYCRFVQVQFSRLRYHRVCAEHPPLPCVYPYFFFLLSLSFRWKLPWGWPEVRFCYCALFSSSFSFVPYHCVFLPPSPPPPPRVPGRREKLWQIFEGGWQHMRARPP